MEGPKRCTLEEAVARRRDMGRRGLRVVFTNGCFDILHPGHVRYLQAARNLGDHLIVAVNSDRSVRALKGKGRPVLDQEARAGILAALDSVDSVLIFDEPDPLEVIQSIVPDVLVKGGDWAEEEIIGADVVTRAGGEVRRIPYVPGYSTSSIIKKIRGADP